MFHPCNYFSIIHHFYLINIILWWAAGMTSRCSITCGVQVCMICTVCIITRDRSIIWHKPPEARCRVGAHFPIGEIANSSWITAPSSTHSPAFSLFTTTCRCLGSFLFLFIYDCQLPIVSLLLLLLLLCYAQLRFVWLIRLVGRLISPRLAYPATTARNPTPHYYYRWLLLWLRRHSYVRSQPVRTAK